MTTPESISIETVLWLIGGAVGIIGSLLVFIFAELNAKVTRIEDKIDANEVKNADDHARVDARLAALEERTRMLLDRQL